MEKASFMVSLLLGVNLCAGITSPDRSSGRVFKAGWPGEALESSFSLVSAGGVYHRVIAPGLVPGSTASALVWARRSAVASGSAAPFPSHGLWSKASFPGLRAGSTGAQVFLKQTERRLRCETTLSADPLQGGLNTTQPTCAFEILPSQHWAVG